MKLTHRAAAVLAAGTLVLTTAGSAQAASVDTSADWLGRQLTNGIVHNDQYDSEDYGLTADTALALKAIGGPRATVRQIRGALSRHVDSWTTGADFGTDDVYAGSVAKAVVLAEATSGDPRAFGGVNLVTRLQRRVSNVAPTVGRIQDKSGYGDYANTIGQSFAARGLTVAGASKAGAATTFLLEQQCAAGFFRLNFAAPADATQGCDAGTATASAPDTDVTALAVLNLQAFPKKSPAVRAAITDAVGWLKRHQKRDGSSVAARHREQQQHSTGLAGWALGAQAPARRPRRPPPGSATSRSAAPSPAPRTRAKGGHRLQRRGLPHRQDRRRHRPVPGPVATGHRAGRAGAGEPERRGLRRR